MITSNSSSVSPLNIVNNLHALVQRMLPVEAVAHAQVGQVSYFGFKQDGKPLIDIIFPAGAGALFYLRKQLLHKWGIYFKVNGRFFYNNSALCCIFYLLKYFHCNGLKHKTAVLQLQVILCLLKNFLNLPETSLYLFNAKPGSFRFAAHVIKQQSSERFPSSESL